MIYSLSIHFDANGNIKQEKILPGAIFDQKNCLLQKPQRWKLSHFVAFRINLQANLRPTL